jgi:imidazolonepropionase
MVINHYRDFQLAGATYMDVHKAGGGINYTVEHTRDISFKIQL